MREGEREFGRNLSAIYGLMVPLGINFGAACSYSSILLHQSLLVFMFSISSSILAPKNTSFYSFLSLLVLNYHIFTFYFYIIMAPYTLSPVSAHFCLKRSQMLLFERQSWFVLFFSFGLRYRKWAPLERRKEE